MTKPLNKEMVEILSPAKPFVRPSENLTPIDPYRCKDKHGNWTKWVLERLDAKEVVLYQEFKDLIKNEPLAADVSVNRLLRTLVSCKWAPKAAAKGLIDA